MVAAGHLERTLATPRMFESSLGCSGRPDTSTSSIHRAIRAIFLSSTLEYALQIQKACQTILIGLSKISLRRTELGYGVDFIDFVYT